MDYAAIQTLEAAAEMLLAPPNLVTPEQRQQAENIFHQFRSTKRPYALCRDILEKSSSDYVLFEAGSLIKSAIIREWNSLTNSDISTLREYLLNYLLRKQKPSFLKEKLLQTVAVTIKRGSITDSGRERRALLEELEKTILSSTILEQKLACSLILAIMQEYAITVKSADVGLVWEVHFRLKKSFEAMDLKRIFRFTVGVIEQIVRSGHCLEGEQILLTKQLLTIAESVLCWSHVSPLLSKRLIGAFEAIYESDTAPALRLSLHWKDTIMLPELVHLFFEIHVYVRSNPDLASPSLTCLVQLASLSGAVVSAAHLKQQYLHNYVNSFMRMLSMVNPNNREMLGIADIYRRLVQFFTPAMIARTPPAFLENLTSFTITCIRNCVSEEAENNETVVRESLNKFLHTWSSLVNDADGYTDETLEGPCTEIFKVYVQCKLAPPDGIRGAVNCDNYVNDRNDEVEEDDRQQHATVLMTIGALARKSPELSTFILTTLITDRSKTLVMYFNMIQTGKAEPFTMLPHLEPVFEDLHWLLMITGHFLALDCNEGETVIVPPEMVTYSIKVKGNMDKSLQYFMGESVSTDEIDPIMKLVGLVLRINDWECALMESGFSQMYSPEVSASTSWLLKIWANSYLMPQASVSSHILEMALGRGSRGALYVISAAARRVSHILRQTGSNTLSASHAIALLTSLAHSHYRESPLASSEEFLALVEWEAAGNNLAGHLRRELHRTFAIATTYAEGEVRNRLLSSTVALQEKLFHIIMYAQSSEHCRNILSDILECFIGVTAGILEVGPLDEQFAMLIGALEKIPEIIFRFHNYSNIVLSALTFLAKTAKRLLHSIQAEKANKFLAICNMTFEVYSQINVGKLTNISQEAEDETYEDICVLMEVVGSVSRSGCGVGASDTCARALHLLLPLVTPPLLALPTLAHNTYRMLRDLDAAEQLTILPIQDFNMVVSALRVGLTAVSCDVSTFCCDTIVGVANKVRTLPDDNPYVVSLLSLAELLLMLIIKMQMPPDSISAAGAAIYALTCIKPALLEGLARELIRTYAANDPANVPRLEEAFGLLTNGVLFDGHRTYKLRFQDNFDKFLASVHGFLIIK